MFGFEKLETWQKAIGFADLVYKAEEQGRMLSGLRGSLLNQP